MQRFLTLFAVALASVLAMATPAVSTADVVDVAAGGFTVRHEVTVNAAPDAIWKGLVDVGNWWNMDHSYSRDGANMTIDARPGGCFCEKLGSSGGVAHAMVVFAAPNQMLRMHGSLGPMQAEGVAGSLTFRIIAGTPAKVEMTYSVGGYRQGGFERVAPAVNGVMTEQVNRLKAFIETGKPVAAK